MAVLARLTDGKVHLSARKGDEGFMAEVKGVEYHTFSGKHPAGNVGVQIHHIDRIAKGDIVWTVNIQDVALIGRLVKGGKLDMTKTIAVTGSEAQKPVYKRIISGAAIESIVGKVGQNVRVISGNVLTGRKVEADGYITSDANQLTLIPEGNVYELLGWAMPRFHRFSVSRAYFSWLCPKKQYTLDTNLNGGERPFVVSGLYDKYLMNPDGLGLDKMLVQGWYNLYQCVLMGIMMVFLWYPSRKHTTPFRWRWSIPFISIFLSIADFVYFYALSLPGAMISIVSMVRRSSVVVSFLFGALVFREKNLRSKTVDLLLVILGMVFLYLGSR